MFRLACDDAEYVFENALLLAEEEACCGRRAGHSVLCVSVQYAQQRGIAGHRKIPLP
jgi:hypothetical protein